MQKFRLVVGAALGALAVATSVPSQAYTVGGSVYSPDGNGGCAATTYFEDWEDYSYYYDVPDLADGQSVSVNPGIYGPGGYSPPDSGYSSYAYTFTCSNGTISGGNSFGYWY